MSKIRELIRNYEMVSKLFRREISIFQASPVRDREGSSRTKQDRNMSATSYEAHSVPLSLTGRDKEGEQKNLRRSRTAVKAFLRNLSEVTAEKVKLQQK